MQLEHYPHKVAAVYADADAAAASLEALQAAALPDAEIRHLYADTSEAETAIEPETGATRDHVVQDLLVGTGIGTGVGAVGAGTLAVILPGLFASAPLVGPLMVAGYGATLGATAGALMGLKVKEGILAGMVRDALRAGQHVVIVHAADDVTRERAQAVLATSLADETLCN